MQHAGSRIFCCVTQESTRAVTQTAMMRRMTRKAVIALVQSRMTWWRKVLLQPVNSLHRYANVIGLQVFSTAAVRCSVMCPRSPSRGRDTSDSVTVTVTETFELFRSYI